jgi:hypothetical protein
LSFWSLFQTDEVSTTAWQGQEDSQEQLRTVAPQQQVMCVRAVVLFVSLFVQEASLLLTTKTLSRHYSFRLDDGSKPKQIAFKTRV